MYLLWTEWTGSYLDQKREEPCDGAEWEAPQPELFTVCRDRRLAWKVLCHGGESAVSHKRVFLLCLCQGKTILELSCWTLHMDVFSSSPFRWMLTGRSSKGGALTRRRRRPMLRSLLWRSCSQTTMTCQTPTETFQRRKSPTLTW